MKVSNKKRALPYAVKILLLCIQHFCAATVAITLVYMILSIGIVGDGTPDGVSFYSLNPFSKEELFEESETFHDIFKDYVKKTALDSVICSQFGTGGEIDENTIIDIVGYANRKNDFVSQENKQLTVTYKLDDLLKWGMYGISYQPYNVESAEDIYALFPEMKEGVSASYTETFNQIYDAALRNNINVREYFNEEDVLSMSFYLPTERYKPVGEKDSLKDYAADWEEYFTLIGILKNTVSDLSINLDTYQKLHEMLRSDKTNFRYYIEVTDKDGYTNAFTNLELNEQLPEPEIKTQGPVYFIWDRNRISYETNMPVEIYEYINSVFSDYEYALGENVKIYYAVNDNYEAPDAFKMGMEKFVITKDIWVYIGIAVWCIIVWLVLFLYLSVMTGRRKVNGETQIVLNWFDYVPTEIAMAICACVTALVVFILQEGMYNIGDFMIWYKYEEDELMLLVFAIAAGVVSILFTFFWYSALRRIKAKTVLKHSLIFRLLAWLWKWIYKGIHAVTVQIQYIYNHSSDASKIMWPFVGLLILHFVVVPPAGIFVAEGMNYGNGELIAGLLLYGILFVIDFLIAMELLKSKVARTEIKSHIKRITQGEIDIRLEEEKYKGENLELAQSVNNIGNGIKTAVETSMKDERMKADLITNVSHDIKTPLTSIINYVDLLKREHIETDPVKGYIEVLDAKSQRLKQLTDDLVEASKISSGNIVLHMDRINLAELLKQSVGEFSEKFEEKRFTIVENYGEEVHPVYADPRRMWRVIENLFNNIYKYGLEGTRVYIDILPNEFAGKKQVLLSIKNISSTQLCVKPEELTERFVRGDDSRTTEGSGLGLSIAKSLVEAQGGALNIILDGDLFKIVILFEESVIMQENSDEEA